MGIEERPILMTGRSVRGIIEGRKTQTRRIIKIDPSARFVQQCCDCTAEFYVGKSKSSEVFRRGVRAKLQHVKNPYGVNPDRLWVRERWAYVETPPRNQVAIYHDGSARYINGTPVTGEYHTNHLKWKPSIHMPRWASRLTLEITDIRVERVQDISKADVIAEGVTEREGQPILDVVAGWHEPFAHLWDSTNGKGAWDRNDWVWVINFRRLQ